MPDDGTKDSTRSDSTRSDSNRSDPTRSDPMKGRAHQAPGEAAAPAPAREIPTGHKPPLSEDTAVHRATPVPPAPTRAPRDGARVLDRDDGDSVFHEDRGGTAAHGRPDAREGRLPDHDTRLLAQDECDKFELRLRHAVGGFVDGPRDSVAEADQVLEELAARFADAVTRRRGTLRLSWQDKTGTDTERLRIALRDYREVSERLLRF
jgi:hypothetical protein